jgi:hypothetical protein
MSNELNIKSSTIEKGLDLAKEFLSKLISPTIDEVGLLISDNIKYLRFKNQVRILLKAKKYVENKNISIKEIPIKILVPLLENASLEDNEQLQDKWANMIVNMVDSESNVQNQVFPYILSQLSIDEYNELMKINKKENDFNEKFSELLTMIKILDDQFILKPETRKLKKEIDKIKQDGFELPIEEFEIANLIRLGLIRQLPPKIYIPEFQTGDEEYEGKRQWHQIEAEYDQENYGFRMTDLGAKFLLTCELKEKAST